MINPIIIILLSAYILSFLVLCILIRPKKPIFTGALLIVLSLFVLLTISIDNAIYNADMMHSFEKWAVTFVTNVDVNDTLSLENSFRIFAGIDIGLFIVTIFSMCIELRTILISVYSANRKSKDKIPENADPSVEKT